MGAAQMVASQTIQVWRRLVTKGTLRDCSCRCAWSEIRIQVRIVDGVVHETNGVSKAAASEVSSRSH